MVLMTVTRPEVYVAIMTTIISDYYYSLVDTLNHITCHARSEERDK